MTGPIDESRHNTTYDGSRGQRSYRPRPWAALTPAEQRTVTELGEILKWMDSADRNAPPPRFLNRRQRKALP